jgi:hypothetical protein
LKRKYRSAQLAAKVAKKKQVTMIKEILQKKKEEEEVKR